jgi:hypothetical protein
LLDALIADFPRRKREAEQAIAEQGLPETLELHIGRAEPTAALPTFDRAVSRPVTPMLAARFAYAGVWRQGLDLWLTPARMAAQTRRRPVRALHRSLREHWEGSAPRLFPDDRLTLFGITEGVEENRVYLVWRADDREPEVWRYAGWDVAAFPNLEAFLRWQLERA